MEELQHSLQPGFTLQEALEIIRGEHDDELIPDGIFLEPPDPAVHTDEESGKEDEESTIDHLPGRQLLAPAELVWSNGQNILGEEERRESAITTQQEKELSIFSRWTRRRLKKISKPRNLKWVKGDLIDSKGVFPNYKNISTGTCIEIFENILTNDILELWKTEAERYAKFKNHNFTTTINELKCFIGIMFLSGYATLPSERLYWDSFQDTKNVMVSEAMRRNRFITIKQFTHFADNSKFNSNVTDKMWKLRPLITIVKKNIMHNFVPEEHLDYDEAMIRYFGKHGCKQFIKGKPLRYGYKSWCINRKDGYLANFQIYQGKSGHVPEDYGTVFGKAAAPFVKLLEEFPDDKRSLPYNFYFDNLFSGANLFRFLKDQGYSGTGTIRENRLPKKCILENKKIFKKRKRGQIDFSIEKKDGILFVRWLDNGVVTLASTAFGVEPQRTIKRYSREKKKNVSIPIPYCIQQYNKYMGGTDAMDKQLVLYRIGIHGKKWWWPIFTWLLDILMVNAWIIYRKVEDIPHLEFRRRIARYYLITFATEKFHPGPSSIPKKLLPEEIRFDGRDHLVCKTIEGKKRKCAGDECKSIIRTMCSKCDVGLCIPCFIPNHKM